MNPNDKLHDRDRRFALAFELRGDELCDLLQALGEAGLLEIQERVKAGWIEITEGTKE